MADYDWFDNPVANPYEETAREWRPKGFEAVFSYTDLYGIKGIRYYHCRRGCGTLVHDPIEHIKNVCPTFNPVVGD